MKRVRPLVIAMIVLFTMMSLTACRGGKKIKLDGDVTGEIKQNGDVNITGNNGESLNFGEELKWPKELMGNLPEIKGKITAVLKDANSKLCTVVFADMKVEDAKKYIEKIKELGYSNGMELSDADVLMISGTAKDSSEATFTYNSTAKEGTVSFKLQGGVENPSNTSTASTTQTKKEAKIVISPLEGWNPVAGSVLPVQYMKNTASFMVKKEPFRSENIDDVVKEAKDAFERTFKDVKYEGEVENITVDGIDARKMVFTCKVSSFQMKYEYVYLFFEGNVYAITFGDLEKTFDSLSADYEQILEGISFE